MSLRVGEVMCVEVGCGVWGSAPVVLGVCTAKRGTANYARRTTAPQGATHQLTVRSQGSLLVAGISDGFATGAYGQQAAAPLIHHSSFIIHNWPAAPWMLARASAKRM